MFVVLVELSDFDTEVLVEGPISSGAIEGKCCIDIFFFSARVRKIKYLNKPEETKLTQPIIYRPSVWKELSIKIHFNLFYCI